MQPRSILQHILPLNIAIVLLACTYAMAQAGQLDTTFATKGIFAAPGERASNAVAIQSDGKIVVAGTGVFNGGFSDMLFRLNTNGTLDTSFGTGGVVNVAGYGLFGLAIQSNGSIVTVGTELGSFQVVRVLSNGGLDPSFGSGGFTTSIVVGGLYGGQGTPDSGSLALQPNGDIVVVEGSGNPSLMVRYTASGQLDSSFGSGGLVNLRYPSPTQVALQSTGKILVASGVSGILGFGLAAATAQAGEITRYNSNGTVDTSFGAAGTVASVASASALVLQSDGKIVVGGAITSELNAPLTASGIGFGIVRYSASGALDRTFGKAGVAIANFGATAPQTGAYALAIQSNGDIVAGGAAGITVSETFTSSFGLSRFTSTGTLDPTFGTGGIVITPIGGAICVSSVSALAIQSDSKIVAAGTTEFQYGCEFDAYVARYLSQ
jgi:uncharacterized delta-60 repeat protein